MLKKPAVWLIVVLTGVVGAVMAVAPAYAATRCSQHWHSIRHGELGQYLTVRATGRVVALGDINVDPWNEWVLFCRDPGWAPNHYAVLMNVTGKYWYYDPNSPSEDSIMGTAGSIVDTHQLFEVQSYDGYWSTIQTVWIGALQHYIEPNRASASNNIVAGPLVRNGHTLYRIEPGGDPLG
jgi:hypothetical protein